MKNILFILCLLSGCANAQTTYILGVPKSTSAFTNAVIVCDGNSVTYGFGSSDPATKSYPALLQGLAPFSYNGATVYNFGVNSATTQDMIDDAATQIDPLYTPGVKNILIALEVGNDIYFNGDAAAAYTRYVSYCNARRAAGFKVIAVTTAYREHSVCCAGLTPFGDSDAAYDAKRLSANASIRANWATFADALFDFGANANFSSYNATYFISDKVHESDAGYALEASLILPIILSL